MPRFPSAVGLKSNLTATVAPTVNDDITLGYVVGSEWVNLSTDKAYICLDNTDAAAVWTETTQPGGASEADISTIRTNSALNAFRIAVNGSLTRFNLQDGVIDDFQDDSGILSGGEVSGGKFVCFAEVEKTLTALGENAPAANADDDSTGTYWNSLTIPTWIKADMAASEIITHVEIKSYVPNNTYSPTDFTIEGSATGAFSGEETVLSTLSGVSWTAGEEKMFEFVNTTAYRYYRINISSVVSAADAIITELNFYRISDVISNNVTAESQPTNIHAVILADDAAIVLNTDLKMYVSVDDGATWEQITLEDSGDYNPTAKILTGSTVIAGTGTTIKYKIECTQAEFEFYAVGLLWD